jgi:peptide/nickel transport system permease protein
MNAPATATLAPRASSYALQQIYRAFNANATSWIGLVTFLLVVALALLAPLISPYDPLDQDILARLQGPSAAHWFGTDS